MQIVHLNIFLRKDIFNQIVDGIETLESGDFCLAHFCIVLTPCSGGYLERPGTGVSIPDR